jgi:hypothetical protein
MGNFGQSGDIYAVVERISNLVNIIYYQKHSHFLVYSQDEYLKKSRAKKFEKWKHKKAKKRSKSIDEEESDNNIPEETTDSVHATPNQQDSVNKSDSENANITPNTSHGHVENQTPELALTSIRQRHSSLSSRSSIHSTSSRISVAGFGVTPPRLRRQVNTDSQESSRHRHISMPTSTLPTSSPRTHNISTPTSAKSMSSIRSVLRFEGTPSRDEKQNTFTFGSPNFLSPDLLSRKSSSLVTDTPPPKKKMKIKRSHVPGF